MKFILLALVAVLTFAIETAYADTNVRAAQQRLKDAGFYFGEANGTFDSNTSAAVSRYQIRNGLAITGQLDAETAKSLGVAAAPASASAQPQDSGSWQQLRKSDQRFLERLETTKPGRKPGQVARATATPRANRDAPATSAPSAAQAPLTPANEGGAATGQESVFVLSRERLRDYVGAFVLAGLDPRIGAELEFFGDRVAYYDQGTLSRDKIRADLVAYANRWPERRFWIDGNVDVQPQADSRLRVTFPLRYEVRNGGKRSSGKVQKTLVLEVLGEDLQIVGVSERKLRS